jgi:hypothetical protein
MRRPSFGGDVSRGDQSPEPHSVPGAASTSRKWLSGHDRPHPPAHGVAQVRHQLRELLLVTFLQHLRQLWDRLKRRGAQFPSASATHPSSRMRPRESTVRLDPPSLPDPPNLHADRRVSRLTLGVVSLDCRPDQIRAPGLGCALRIPSIPRKRDGANQSETGGNLASPTGSTALNAYLRGLTSSKF